MTEPAFWQPAEARAQLWRTALGLLLIALVWFGATVAGVAGYGRLTGQSLGIGLAQGGFGATAVVFLTLASFHVGLFIVLPLLHRRSYFTLFGRGRRRIANHFALGAAVTLGLGAVLFALSLIEPWILPARILPDTLQARPLAAWLAGLFPALVLIFLQTLAEEAVFRGYLLQQLAARFRSPLIWALAPALVFGLLHFSPATYGWLNGALYVIDAAVMGTFAALVTARTGTLGAAAGLHFGNNALMVLTTYTGSPSGFSLYTLSTDPGGPYVTWSLSVEIVAMCLVFALWARATRLQTADKRTR